MFEQVFEEAIELGVATKTKAIYFVDNQGDYIYKTLSEHLAID